MYICINHQNIMHAYVSANVYFSFTETRNGTPESPLKLSNLNPVLKPWVLIHCDEII